MSEAFIICPQCQQQTARAAHIQYCSFCYTRFPELDTPADLTREPAGQPAPAAPSAATPSGSSAAENSPTTAVNDAPPTASAGGEAAEPPAAPPAPKAISFTDMVCPHCRAELPHGSERCDSCQADLSQPWL